MPAALTFMERKAIADARRPLYEAMVKHGLADAFNNCSVEAIDALIAAAWDGCRKSMQTMSQLDDEIPF